MLEVRLLGTFEVRVDGKLVKLTSRPAQVLLAYLILNPGIDHPREKLAGLLWPESSETAARANLRQALWQLRRQLGASFVQADKTSISLGEAAGDASDVSRLLRGSEVSTTDLLQRASAYAGPLLPGFYEDWVTLERERLQAAFEQEIGFLLAGLLDEKRWREVIEWAERWIALGTGAEAAYRSLMMAHANLGESARVRETYERCTRRLREELGVEPSAETEDLYRSLLAPVAGSQRPARAVQSRGEEAIAFPFEKMAPPDLPPFVGRAEPLAFLERRLDEAVAGRGQVVFVLGDAGQGKTALMREFCRRALDRRPELRVGFGTCDAYTGQGDAYLPFRQISGNLTGGVDSLMSLGLVTPDQARRQFGFATRAFEVINRHSPEIVSLLLPEEHLISHAPPELRHSLVNRLTQRPGLSLDQAIVFEQFSRFFKRTSEQAPLLLLVDDLQWADEASLGLLLHLGRSVGPSPILLVCAHRPSDVAAGSAGSRHPVETVVNELRRRHGEIVLDLQEAEAAEGRVFCDCFLDTEPNHLGEPFRQALFERTGGHPLFTIELLRTLQERGDLTKDSQNQWVEGHTLNWGRLPERVEAVIQERVDRLDQELRRIIDIASVEGDVFSVEVVGRVSGRRRDELIRTLSRELERGHRLVREVQLEGGVALSSARFQFSHQLIQRHVYADLGENERRLLHSEVAEAIEEIYRDRADDAAVALAHHFREAGNQEKAIAYHRRAAEIARERFAYKEAIHHYTEALVLMPSGDPARFDVHLSRSWLASFIADREAQRADIAEMKILSRTLGGREREFETLLAEADRLTSSDAVAARRTAEVAVQIAQSGLDTSRLARALILVGDSYVIMSQHDRARDWLERAAEALRPLGPSRLLARALSSLSTTFSNVGELQRARKFASEARSIARSFGDRPEEARALRRIALSYGEDWLTNGYPIAVEAMTLHRELGDREGEMASLHNIGIGLAEAGHYEEARSYLLQCLEQAFALQSERYLFLAPVTLAFLVDLPLGTYEAGIAFVSRVCADVASHGSAWLLGHLDLWRASLQHNLGAYEVSLQGAERAATLLEPLDDAEVPDAYSLIAVNQAEMGDFAAAYRSSSRVQEAMARLDPHTRSRKFWPRRDITRMHLAKGWPSDDSEALQIASQALDAARLSGDRGPLMEAPHLWARVQLELGNLGIALEASTECMQIYEASYFWANPVDYLSTHADILRLHARGEEADEYLARAYRRVAQVASCTTSPEFRHAWLTNVRVNRKVVAEAVARGIGEEIR